MEKFHSDKNNPNAEIQISLKKINEYFKNNNFVEAEKICSGIIEIKPTSEIISLLALIQTKLGKIKEAESNYLKSLELDPDNVEALFNIATLYHKKNDLLKAENFYAKVIKIDPEFEKAHYNLGIIFRVQNKLSASKNKFLKVIELNPQNTDAIYNLSVVYELQNNFQEALKNYIKVVEINPNHFDAKWNLALLQIRLGKWKEGWENYEVRLQKKEYKTKFSDISFWQGENVKQKKIIFRWEQGFGDAIEFSRFAKLFFQKGAAIIFESKKRIAPLFENQKFINQIIIKEEFQKVDADYQIFPCSIPNILKLNPEEICFKDKYLDVKELLIEKWSGKIRRDNDKIKIGFVWKGSSENASDEFRSIKLEYFLKLKNEIDADFISLQFDLTKSEKQKLIEAEIKIVQEDFLNTAAVTKNLDLVITVDTYLSHLCGALGVRTLLLLSEKPDWRWGTKEKPVNWYNSVNVIWKETNSWENVFTFLVNEINSQLYLNADFQKLLKQNKFYSALKYFNLKFNDSDKKKHISVLVSSFNAVGLEILDFVGKNEINKNSKVEINLSKKENCNSSGLFQKLKSALNNDEEVESILTEIAESGNISADGNLLAASVAFNLEYFDLAFLILLNLKMQVPNNAKLYSNLAVLFSEVGFYKTAEKYFMQVFSQKPNDFELLLNIAVLNYEQGKFSEAEKYLIEILKNDPNNTKAKFNLSLIKLAKGNYLKGFELYEERFKIGDGKFRMMKTPRWNGEPIKNKVLYVYADEGLGDIIQYSRYLKLVKPLAGKVIFEARKSLIPLFELSDNFDEIIEMNPDKSVSVFHDCQIPIMSLPFIFKTIENTIPPVDKYFSEIEPNEKLQKNKNLKIGLCWRGNESNKKLLNRFLSLELIEPLLAIKNVDFYSFQFDATEKEKQFLQLHNVKIINEYLNGFLPTARAVKAMDLIVTVDTSLVHIAGSVRKKTFLLLPFVADWKWGINKKNTLWYDSIEIFRQKKLNNWSESLVEIRNEIVNFRKQFFLATEKKTKASNSKVNNSKKETEFVKVNNSDRTLYLALSKGENFGWGVCSKYFKKEVPKLYSNVKVWDFENDKSEPQNVEGIVFHGLTGLNFESITNIRGNKNFGYTFFENELPDKSIENSKKYDLILAGSTWCKTKMEERGINNSGILIQGIDPEIFYPLPPKEETDLFVIFSGGKFELRKSQDLVLRAVKILQDKYPNVILINAWYNMWPNTMRFMAEAKNFNFDLQGNSWQEIMMHLYKINGLDLNRVITLELIQNNKLPEIYLKTDIGIFPNRCEGGTNLVMMEYMACGKPVIASYNTGHKDILTEENSLPIFTMKSFERYSNNKKIARWYEPDFDEIVEKLEYAYLNRNEIRNIGKQAGKDLKNFTWKKSAEQLLNQIL